MKSRKFIFTAVITALLLNACATPQPTLTPVPTATAIPTATLVPTATPQPETQPYTTTSKPFAQIDVDFDIEEIVWSKDSQVLFIIGEGKDSKRVLSYNINNNSEKEFFISNLFNLESPQPNKIPLPSTAFNISVSPSGTRALYMLPSKQPPTLTPTPIATPIPSGEVGFRYTSAEVWLWENGSTYKIANSLDCKSFRFFWVPDERRVIVPGAGPGCNYQTIANSVIDTLTKEIHFLNERNIFLSGASLYALSKDGEKFLYIEGLTSPLKVFYPKTLVSQTLDTPEIYEADWMDEENIIFTYFPKPQKVFQLTVGILNFSTSKWTELINTGRISMLKDMNILHRGMSPDRQWYAISGGKHPYFHKTIWLFKISKTPKP